VTVRNRSTSDASGWGVVCDGCEAVSGNQITGLTDVVPCADCYRYTIALSAGGSPLVDANILDGGCSSGTTAYNAALEAGSARIQNNRIRGSHDCGVPVGMAYSFGITAGNSDIHSNLIEAGETQAADCYAAGILLNTYPNQAILRNNIVMPGACPHGIGVAEGDGDADADFTPAVLENNDLVAGPPGTALYRDHGVDLTTVDEVNALTDLTSSDNFSAPCPLPLVEGSPCVDVGTPEGAPDHDMEDQLRDDGLPDVGPDELIPPQGPFVELAAAGFATCGMRANGFLECWGFSQTYYGVPRYRSFDQLSMGGERVCALRLDGTAVCWGQAFASLPPDAFLELSSGGNHDCGLKLDHTVACWGGDAAATSAPAGIFDAIASGGFHSCGLRPDGSVTCWGDNAWGQADAPPGSFGSICSGYVQSCGLRLDGTIDCWGDVSWLQDWAPPPSGSFEAVFCGGTLACALDAVGGITCWGQNHAIGGQRIAPDGAFKKVALGTAHGCAIRLDDEVLCWGANEFGESTPPE
jgi:hypothetical protein